jgi:hypothetical protein
MESLVLNLAYRYVALALMVAEANHAIERLGIPQWKAFGVTELSAHFVAPPRRSLGGSIETTNFFFGFAGDGKLRYIHCYNHLDRKLPLPDQYAQWAKLNSLIGTNEAYQVASNWLDRLEVDLAALERRHPPHVMQARLEGEQTPDGRTALVPRFEVAWGTNMWEPVVWVSIFGPTKEPLRIRIEDTAFLKRPKGLVKNPESLLAIKDADFARYTSLEKSNLVVKSAVSKYKRYSLPEVVAPTSGTAKGASQAPVDTRTPTRFPQPKIKTVPPASQPKE